MSENSFYISDPGLEKFINNYLVKRTKLFIGFVLMLIFVSLVMIFYFYKMSSEVSELTNEALKIEYYDEVLTSSAFLASYSGEKRWEYRYNGAEILLDKKLSYYQKSDPEIFENSLKQVDKANQKLIELEREAFELVKANKLAEAQEVLNSRAYDDNKSLYKKGFLKFVSLKKEKLDRQKKQVEFLFYGLIFFFFTLSVLIIFMSIKLKDIIGYYRFSDKVKDRQAEKVLSFMTQTPAAIAVLDREMKYIASSDAWLRLFRLEFDSIVGLSHYDLFPNISDEWRIYHQRCLLGETISREEDYYKLNDQNELWLTWRISPWFVEEKEIGGMIVYCEDLTDKKKSENVILHQSKLATIGTMSATVAHEIRNPLAIIKSSSDLLLKGYERDKLDKEQLSRYLERINTGVSRILEIVERLRVFSRNDKVQETKMSVFDVNEFIKENIEFMKDVYSQEGIEIKTSFYPSRVLIRGNHSELAQVIVNLLSNAKDAIENCESPEITISTSVLSGEVDKAAIIEIKDNGLGIDEKVRDRVFEKFFTTKSPEKGTGIGMSYAKSVVEKYHGEIGFESGKKGTTFFLKFPLA